MKEYVASFEFRESHFDLKSMEIDVKSDSKDLAYSFLYPLVPLMSSHMERDIELHIYAKEEEK